MLYQLSHWHKVLLIKAKLDKKCQKVTAIFRYLFFSLRPFMLSIRHSDRLKCAIQIFRSHRFVWVEHNSNTATSGMSWQVLGELCSDASDGSVGLDDLTPDDSESSVVYGFMCLEDVSNSLSEIEFGSSQVVTVLDLDQCLIFPLGSLSSSESGENTFNI